MKVKALKAFLEQYDDNDEISFITKSIEEPFLIDKNRHYFSLKDEAPTIIY